LTKQLLTFANGGAPVRRAAAVGELVRSTVEFALHGSRCRAVFDIAADLMVAEVDEGQIGQVITNLAINAIEATLHGGELQITCANCELGEANPFVCAPGPYVEISIRDHGVGIAPEILPRIFEPYFSTKQQKSGLGLATAYSIAKRHGGALVAESKLGDGATFRMLLPAAPDAVIVERAPEPKTVRPGQRGVRVLVMDDEEALLTALVSMLSDLGFEPEGASDGAQAVRLFQQARELGRPFEVSILDLTVPGGMGGLETLKQLLAIDPRTRAIATSGYAPDPILAQPSRYGFVDSLPKPYRLDELTTAVRRASQQQP
jgi:CheY-like chemotaxis protein